MEKDFRDSLSRYWIEIRVRKITSALSIGPFKKNIHFIIPRILKKLFEKLANYGNYPERRYCYHKSVSESN
jgi:hypothetical protein